MSDKTTTANYSPEQEAAIKAASPLNLETAKSLGAELGKSYRSIIAKALSLECEYVSKPPPAKRVAQVTKAELVTAISDRLNTNLSGLEKATSKALVDLLDSITPDSVVDVAAD